MRIEHAQLRIRRRLTAREAQRQPEQPAHTCSRLAMPKVGFDAAAHNSTTWPLIGQHRRRERSRLDRVAERRARAVRLVERDRLRVYGRVSQCTAQQTLLRLPIWRRQAR
jgi:hypothetical protein